MTDGTASDWSLLTSACEVEAELIDGGKRRIASNGIALDVTRAAGFRHSDNAQSERMMSVLPLVP
jgi:hypothetical protein